MTYRIRPGHVTDQYPEDGDRRAVYADGYTAGVQEVLTVITPALVFLETRTGPDGKTIINTARDLIAHVKRSAP